MRTFSKGAEPNFPTFLSRAREKASPDFRFSGQGPNFRRSHEVPLVKPTLTDNGRTELTFQSSRAHAVRAFYSESKTAKSSSCRLDIETLSENHEILCLPLLCPPPSALPPSSLYLSPPPHRFIVRVFRCSSTIISHLRSRDSDNGPSKYLFFGPVVRAADLKRGPLNLVWSDNGPDETPEF